MGVSFRGLEKLALDMKETIPQKCSQAIAEMTRETGEEMHLRYQENLQGSSPSTAENPLPVGMVSGETFAGATLEIVNQYSWRETNESENAAWSEFGTKKMVARAPMQDAVDILERQMEAQMEEVMRQVTE